MPQRQSQRTVSSSFNRSNKTKKKTPLTTILVVVLCGCVVLFGFAFSQFHNETKEWKNTRNYSTEHERPPPPPPKSNKASSTTTDATDADDPPYHMVFSTGCSPFQDWQSMMFFYHASKVKQRGSVTRIASGCNDEEKITEMKRQFKEQIQVLSPNFHIHFTPNWGFTSETNKYWNKPFGLLDWFEKELGYPDTSASQKHDDSIIMILDPDMMLLRPLTHKFHDFPQEYWLESKKPLEGRELRMQVEHGWPISQAYGFGDAWLRSFEKNKTYVLADYPDSPVYDVTTKQAQQYYPSGPPYLATSRDMYKIVKQWVEFVQRIGVVFPQMMAEMYAYSTASAHLKLPHQVTEKFMVSDVGMVKNEGWDFLKDVPKEESCKPKNPPLNEMPYVLHYCQRYALGRWFVGKYKLPTDFFSCPAPLIKEPPHDVGAKYDWFIYPNNKEHEEYFGPTQVHDSDHKIKANAFAMCTMIHGLNEVAAHYKKHHCSSEIDALINFNPSFHFQEKDETFVEFLEKGGLGKII